MSGIAKFHFSRPLFNCVTLFFGIINVRTHAAKSENRCPNESSYIITKLL
jgi:hypothetical protein